MKGKRPLKKKDKGRLIIFNKPFNVLCQFTDKEGRKTLADYIPIPGVYAAGRLDYDSEGLVVLTDIDGVQRRVAEPRCKLPKKYLVQVEGLPGKEAIDRLRNGVVLSDGPARATEAQVVPEPDLWPRVPPIRFRKKIPETWLSLTITEGRNRQVRRMTAAVGLPTLRLIRVSVGPWSRGRLKPGEWAEAALPEGFI